MTFGSLIKQPSAIIPLLMSLAAFILILAVLFIAGVTVSPSHDERAPARIFQLLIVLQVPIVAAFALKWLPRSPRSALIVLLLQAAAAVMAVATIVWLESGVGG